MTFLIDHWAFVLFATVCGRILVANTRAYQHWIRAKIRQPEVIEPTYDFNDGREHGLFASPSSRRTYPLVMGLRNEGYSGYYEQLRGMGQRQADYEQLRGIGWEDIEFKVYGDRHSNQEPRIGLK